MAQKKRKLTVTYAGQTFSRVTAADYKHVVLLLPCYVNAMVRAKARSGAENEREEGIFKACQKALISGDWRWIPDVYQNAFHGALDFAHFQARIIATSVAQIEDQNARGVFNKWIAKSWHTRRELAFRSMDESAADPRYARSIFVDVE